MDSQRRVGQSDGGLDEGAINHREGRYKCTDGRTDM